MHRIKTKRHSIVLFYYHIAFLNFGVMNRKLRRGVVLFIGALSFPVALMGQEKVESDISVDLVSGYIWRGQDLGNVSLQPSVSLSYKGFSLSGWGSVGFDKDDTKEFDLTLGYATGGFSVSVTDYWFNQGPGYFHYGATDTNHVFEAQVGYDFGVVAVNWYTNFAGNDGLTSSGKRAYSSYFSAAVPFRLGGLEWEAVVGAVPWGTDFYNAVDGGRSGAGGFEVSEVALGASKSLRVTDGYSLSLFGRMTWNPATEGAYFVCGVTF